MRIILTASNCTKLFAALFQKGFDYARLAKEVGVCERTMRDWAKAKFSMTEEAYAALVVCTDFSADELLPKRAPDFWHIASAAKKGGAKRQKLYGDLGTPEGRRKGGLRSVEVHKNLPGGFRTLKPTTTPVMSADLAEFAGIIAGDGHLAKYQVLMVTNSETDRAHAFFVAELGRQLFSVEATICKRKKEKAVNVLFSSKQMVQQLQELGLPKGNKLRNGLKIPGWVHRTPEWERAFLRGLFDTDGCVFIDKHRKKNKLYAHIGMTISSASPSFLADILLTMRNLGFHPTHQAPQVAVFLRRQEDVHRYFKQIGSHNPKHICRYNDYSITMERCVSG